MSSTNLLPSHEGIRKEGSTMDLNKWVIQIRERLDIEEVEEEEKVSASIFNVPKQYGAIKPEAFIPQVVSIGPYHHWRSELYEMERYKLTAARRIQKRLIKGKRFLSVVEEFHKYEWQIRSCYHKYIDHSGETLAWLMALDASFLLQCLQFFQHEREPLEISACFIKEEDDKHLGPLVRDPKGKSTLMHNGIARDIMLLENQVPLFLLQKLLEMQLAGDQADQKANQRLWTLLRAACRELSPFNFDLPEMSKERGHLLEFLYYALVPTPEPNDYPIHTADIESSVDMTAGPFRRVLNLVWKFFSSLNVGPVKFVVTMVRRSLNARPVQILMKLPWRLVSSLFNLPILRILKAPWGFLFTNMDDSRGSQNSTDGASSGHKSVERAPLFDELVIPSVAELRHAGVKFAATKGDLNQIRFDSKCMTLYLPSIRLDHNTEVLLRNLIAFEVSVAPGAMVFARYTDFMNGMIDSEEDVRLLRQKGIIHSHLKNDEEVAKLWNSLGYVRLTKVAYLDKVIRDLNKYYNRKWNVAIAEFVKKYIFGSWQILSLLAAALLLCLTFLQAFCSVYDCNKWYITTQD
eukprot:Gb_20047 [translate_table: standard]